MTKKTKYLFAIPTLVLLLGTVFFLSLPYLCDFYLLPRLLKELPFTEKEISISRLSPWQMRGTVTLADKGQPALSIPRFELHYKPTDLLRGKVTSLLIDSASLHVDMTEDGPIIRGLTNSKATVAQDDTFSPLLLPLGVETVIVKSSTLSFHGGNGESFNFISDGRISLDFIDQGENKKLLSALSGELEVRGDATLTAIIDGKTVQDEHKIHLQLHAPNISELSAFFPEIHDQQVRGAFSVDARTSIQHLKRITAYEATAQISGFHYQRGGFVINNRSADQPITLNVEGNVEKTKFSLAGLMLSEPEKSYLNLVGELGISQKTFSGIGNISFDKTATPLALHFNGSRKQGETQLSYQLQSGPFNLTDSTSISPFKGAGSLNIKGTEVSGELLGKIAKIADKKSGTTLIGLLLQLPFEYPLRNNADSTAGSFTVEEIQYQGVNSGKFQASLQSTSDGVDFTTKLSALFNPKLQLSCSGSAKLPMDVHINCQLPETEIHSNSLPAFVQLPDELTLQGELSGNGEFSLKDFSPAGRLAIGFHNGVLNYGDNNLSGINLDFDLPHLPLIASRSGQICTINSLKFGKVKLSEARFQFRVEDKDSIFLEKGKLNWCGGKVETGGLNLSRTMEEFEATLYCDRLSFTELLSQFGIEDAEGEGSLNGKLPILVNKQRIIFNDGFLFSTPGNSGIVRFNNTSQLRQGMPNIDQSAYLDYSMKALENFSYNWTKLSFNSQEEELLIAMQLDGKPAEPLPFGYKNGQIIPTSKGAGIQHPIRLDVNFRLPLQDLFQYGRNIQSIMENM